MPSVRAPGGAVRSSLARNPLLVDAGIAVALSAVSLLLIVAGARDFSRTDGLGLTLALLQTVPLALRRRFPIGVLVVTMAALVGQAALASASFNSSIGGLVALYTAAEQCDRRTGIAAAIGAGLAIAGVILAKVGVPAGFAGLVQSLLSVFVVWLVGTWAQERRRYIGTIEERARRAEQERETRAALAVAQERARIARELHDVVAHHVSVIVISAGAGLRALERRPQDAREALEAIDASGRRAIADMRRMVGVLGPGAGPATPGEAPGTEVANGTPPAPMPGLDRLGELIERLRATGLRTELAVEGTARDLDPGVELSAYRIVQEALTNTLKHAPGARATVRLRYATDALEIEVTDDGGTRRGTPAALAHPGEPGHGLLGMRERVALFGGRLEAGRRDAGYRVAATLPFGSPMGSVASASTSGLP